MNPPSTASGRLRLLPSWLALNTVLLSLVAILSLTYPVEELSRRIGDTYFRLRPRQPTSHAVAIVLIDDVSLQRYGRWPWPRGELAQLVHAVSRQGPASIGLDILLPEAGDAAGDRELARAIQDAGNVVLATKVEGVPERLWVDPLPLFRSHAAGIGHVQAVMDSDGIGRRVPLVELSADGPRWPLTVEMVRVATGQPIHLDGRVLWIGNRRAWIEGKPNSTHGNQWAAFSPQYLDINFRHQYVAGEPNPPFVAVSAASLLSGSTHPELTGKAILIGFGASDLSDRIPTPVSVQAPMPGVEVHANVLDELLMGDSIRHADLRFEILLLLGFSAICSWFVLRHAGWISIWIPLLSFAAIYESGSWLLHNRGILLNLGPLLCAAILTVPLAQLENLAIVNRVLNRGLHQLRGTLSAGSDRDQLASFQPDTAAQASSADLQKKLDLVSDLQSELAESYAFRQNLLESIHEALAVFDSAGNSRFRNPQWESFCHKQKWDPLIGLPELGRKLGHPAWSKLEDRMREDQIPSESEVYLGGGFWQVRAIRLAGEGADERRWMVMITDLKSRLERDQARAEALRFVTHELRTPLVSIQGFSEFLLRYPQADGSSEAALTIFRESQRLVSLINTYLDVLRFDAGARSLRKDTISIGDMVEQVEKVMAPIADSAEIRIRVELGPNLPELIGDRPMLTGVILNLLNNAVKYSPPDSEVSLRVRDEESAVSFEVSNPGVPIPAEQLSRLFEPFFRAQDQETSRPGWGLGLTFVKRIVEEHRGSIEARSDESGIRVTVRLPTAISTAGFKDGAQ
jgi:signal transduction histidine kinase/CHASE2 domain-containing sensor protein